MSAYRTIGQSLSPRCFLRSAACSLSPSPVGLYSPRFIDESKEQMTTMNQAGKDRLAEEVIDLWVTFQMALSNKRKYPAGEFNAFSKSVRRYVDVIGRDPLIHREIAKAINGLVDFLRVERRRVLDAV